jgi:DNA-binding GntR family transcriptional regulator
MTDQGTAETLKEATAFGDVPVEVFGLARDTSTLAGMAFSRLRADILCCAFAPGDKLRLEALRTRYGIGFSPLREALSRLTGEGLVVVEGQRGFRVATASAADLRDITAIRCEIEPLALRLSIERGDDAWEAHIAAAMHHLSILPRRHGGPAGPGIDEWARRHRAFHDGLVSACGSPRLMRIRQQLFDHAERYQRLLISRDDYDRKDEAEHRALYEAVIARDAETASTLMVEHITQTANFMQAVQAGAAEARG